MVPKGASARKPRSTRDSVSDSRPGCQTFGFRALFDCKAELSACVRETAGKQASVARHIRCEYEGYPALRIPFVVGQHKEAASPRDSLPPVI